MRNKLQSVLVEKIKNYKQILKEVETTSMEEALANFCMDYCPEREIFVWECIAIAYKNYVSDKQDLGLAKKKEILAILLGLSTGMDHFNYTKLLNKNEIEQIKKTYFD